MSRCPVVPLSRLLSFMTWLTISVVRLQISPQRVHEGLVRHLHMAICLRQLSDIIYTDIFAPRGLGPQVSMAGPLRLMGRAIDTLFQLVGFCNPHALNISISNAIIGLQIPMSGRI